MIHHRLYDVFTFLWAHLEKDMMELGKALSQNMDNTAVTVHLILTRSTKGQSAVTFILLLPYVRLKKKKL